MQNPHAGYEPSRLWPINQAAGSARTVVNMPGQIWLLVRKGAQEAVVENCCFFDEEKSYSFPKPPSDESRVLHFHPSLASREALPSHTKLPPPKSPARHASKASQSLEA